MVADTVLRFVWAQEIWRGVRWAPPTAAFVELRIRCCPSCYLPLLCATASKSLRRIIPSDLLTINVSIGAVVVVEDILQSQKLNCERSVRDENLFSWIME